MKNEENLKHSIFDLELISSFTRSVSPSSLSADILLSGIFQPLIPAKIRQMLANASESQICITLEILFQFRDTRLRCAPHGFV
jgi:hypothetical protein